MSLVWILRLQVDSRYTVADSAEFHGNISQHFSSSHVLHCPFHTRVDTEKHTHGSTSTNHAIVESLVLVVGSGGLRLRSSTAHRAPDRDHVHARGMPPKGSQGGHHLRSLRESVTFDVFAVSASSPLSYISDWHSV